MSSDHAFFPFVPKIVPGLVGVGLSGLGLVSGTGGGGIEGIDGLAVTAGWSAPDRAELAMASGSSDTVEKKTLENPSCREYWTLAWGFEVETYWSLIEQNFFITSNHFFYFFQNTPAFENFKIYRSRYQKGEKIWFSSKSERFGQQEQTFFLSVESSALNFHTIRQTLQVCTNESKLPSLLLWANPNWALGVKRSCG